MIIKYSSGELNRLVWEINKIGVNINQIAKLANKRRTVSEHDLQVLLSEHKKVKSMIEHMILSENFLNHFIEISK